MLTKVNTVKKFKMPNSIVIIIFIIVCVTALTWIVPAGEFTREKNDLGITVIVPSEFTYVDAETVSLFSIPKFIVEGFLSSSDLFFLIIFSGCAFDVITSSGALQSLVAMIARKFLNKEIYFLPIVTLFFAIICTTQGVNIFMAFAPITVMIAIAMGFDSIVGVSMILLGGAVGFSTGTLNLSTTIVSQKIADLPLYSGIEYRALCFIIFFIVTNIYLIRYAKKIKANPQLSPVYELDKNRTDINDSSLDDFGHLSLRKVLVVCCLAGSLIIMVYGGVKLKWNLKENTQILIWLGIISGICAGYNPNKIADCFINGAKRMVGAAIILGLARSISGILTTGGILDTIVYGFGMILQKVPYSLQGIAMYIINTIVNVFIVSGSGQAAVVMPIFIPLADMVDISRQTAILAYNFGDGFCNYIIPMSTALMGNLSVVSIPYEKWMKFMWKLFVIWMLVSCILVYIAQLINLGPM